MESREGAIYQKPWNFCRVQPYLYSVLVFLNCFEIFNFFDPFNITSFNSFLREMLSLSIFIVKNSYYWQMLGLSSDSYFSVLFLLKWGPLWFLSKGCDHKNRVLAGLMVVYEMHCGTNLANQGAALKLCAYPSTKH